jgi:tripartite-type tricarboxylate transporter receptor subunit TctC
LDGRADLDYSVRHEYIHELRKGGSVSQATFSRRGFCGGLVGTAAAGCCAGVAPGRALGADDACATLSGESIRWIVPSAPGGGFDAYSRLFGPFLETALGAEVVVVNVPGANGLIGSNALMDAVPDGRTLGVLNGPGLLVARLLGDSKYPSLTADFTLLGRLARDREVWVTAAASPIETIDDLVKKTRKIVFAVQGVSGTLVSSAVGSELMGVEVGGFLTAYAGTADMLLGMLRGEFDVTSLSWSSVQASVKAGEIRPLLQISDTQAADEPALAGVPALGGASGLAVRRARALGRDVAAAEAQATALEQIVSAGRFVAAPAGMSQALIACLEKRLYETMTAPGFVAAAKAAGRPLDVARGSEMVGLLLAAERTGRAFRPILDRSIAIMRG